MLSIWEFYKHTHEKLEKVYEMHPKYLGKMYEKVYFCLVKM